MDIAQVRSMLASILAEIDGGVPGAQTTQAPPGFVYVVPTGPEGAGKARLWPQPHPEQGEMLLGYATRCMNTIDQTTTLPYYPRGQYGMILQGAAHGNPNFAEAHRSLGIFYKTEPGYLDPAKSAEHFTAWLTLVPESDDPEGVKEVRAWLAEIPGGGELSAVAR